VVDVRKVIRGIGVYRRKNGEAIVMEKMR
jgi:hypothetical protein